MSRWFSKQSLVALANTKKNAGVEIDPTTATMIGAYKQFDDIEFLMHIIMYSNPNPPMTDEQARKWAEVCNRHAKYKAAQEATVPDDPRG
jgi:hypothetical protein